MKPTTAQQVNTLLYYLQTKQTPPFKILFWENLQKIDFDYSANSLQRLSQFFAAMAKRHIQLPQLLANQSGQALIVALAAYIADYLAKTTGQPIAWYDYDRMSAQLARQNKYPTQSQLPADFYASLTARIGHKVYCQPLKLLPDLLQGKDVLPQFIAQMTQTLYQQSQVNLLQSPEAVCQGYLAKVKTGKLQDAAIAFSTYLAAVNFDNSRDSLVQIDEALSAIQQAFGFTQADYLDFLQDTSRQAFCYLLGFYIGVTSSRLANAPVRWVSFAQMYDSLGEAFAECLEHSFVLLFEDYYRTPMLVVTNRLFGLASSFPTTAAEFADILQRQNAGHIAVYPYQDAVSATADLPAPWTSAMQAAGALVASVLSRLSQGEPILPSVYQAHTSDNTGGELTAFNPSNIALLSPSDTDLDTATATDTDALIDSFYQTLHQNPQLAPVIVGCFDSYTNLPMGRTEGIVIEIWVYENPRLQLQLVLPYQSANDWHSLKIYPLVSHQNGAQTALTSEQITALTTHFYQALLSTPSTQNTAVKTLWQDAYVNQLDSWVLPPKDQRIQQQNAQLVTRFDFALLPILDNQTNVNMAAFDYTSIDWLRFDLAKHILQASHHEQSYLQVYVSDKLIKDELYRQVEATENLYRYGKVVWGVVIKSDVALTQPMSEEERDTPFANYRVSCADILFDPSGQARVEDLQAKARQLMDAVGTVNQPANTTPDLAFYQLHYQDDTSRVFNLAYPASIAATNYRITTSWIWRRHLPNGMLSNSVVPIIIHTNAYQNKAEQGEIMVLPSQLWDKAYYHYWLSLAYEQFGQDYDLLPYIHWQHKYAQDSTDAATQKRLWPKFKPNRAPSRTPNRAQSSAIGLMSDKLENPMSATAKQQGSLQQVTIQQTTGQKLADVKPTLQPSTESTPQTARAAQTSQTSQTSQTPKASPSSLSNELTQQLMNDKLRLQTQLSTKDTAKDKKLLVMAIGGVLVLIIMVILVKLMR
ncbi:hypothetical protein RNZ41_08235 [Moraxella sp. DOX410]|nr:hypothetical protein [Moraxella sp. DOX410]WNP27068.1 hypothetical protein RNZ41_08235 [Moraxella sp. DOX410]